MARRHGSIGLAIGLALAVAPVAEAAGPGGWQTVGGRLNDAVYALDASLPGQLLVGGRFTDAGGNPAADRIARWDGSAWSALGPADSLAGTATFVSALATSDGKVYAGGTFGDGAGPKPDNLAVWDGAAWSSFCVAPGGPVDALQVIGSTLYVGGAFSNVGGNPNADNLIRCNLGDGTFGGGTVDGPDDIGGRVQALAADAGGNLYAGGSFINLDGIAAADYVAKLSGSTWSALGTPAAIDTVNVDALATAGTSVYVGTDDDDIAGDPAADHVARWDGAAWAPVGQAGYFPSGGAARINELLPFGAGLIATGSFADAGGDPLADHVAVFDGSTWSHLGSSADGANGPFSGEGFALTLFGGQPVLGGAFTDAGGDPLADRLASFPPAVPDPTPTATATATATPAPAAPAVARLGRTPAKRVLTRGRRAKVAFRFGGDGAARFVCRLDRRPFATCVSPKRLRVKPGRHTFAVAGVNADGERGKPDRYAFKVVRRR